MGMKLLTAIQKAQTAYSFLKLFHRKETQKMISWCLFHL